MTKSCQLEGYGTRCFVPSEYDQCHSPYQNNNLLSLTPLEEIYLGDSPEDELTRCKLLDNLITFSSSFLSKYNQTKLTVPRAYIENDQTSSYPAAYARFLQDLDNIVHNRLSRYFSSSWISEPGIEAIDIGCEAELYRSRLSFPKKKNLLTDKYSNNFAENSEPIIKSAAQKYKTIYTKTGIQIAGPNHRALLNGELLQILYQENRAEDLIQFIDTLFEALAEVDFPDLRKYEIQQTESNLFGEVPQEVLRTLFTVRGVREATGPGLVGVHSLKISGKVPKDYLVCFLKEFLHRLRTPIVSDTQFDIRCDVSTIAFNDDKEICQRVTGQVENCLVG